MRARKIIKSGMNMIIRLIYKADLQTNLYCRQIEDNVSYSLQQIYKKLVLIGRIKVLLYQQLHHLMPEYHNKMHLETHSQLPQSFPSLISPPHHKLCVNPEESKHFNKEKSELCKQYVQTGFCIYEKRCKFAHGSHELQSNRETNMKYKTKRCEHFWQNNYCIYGDRCNYIHLNPNPPPPRKQRSCDVLITSIWKSAKKSSKLLDLLSKRSDK